MGRNPQTGEKIKIKGRNAVTFRPGKNLEIDTGPGTGSTGPRKRKV